MPEIRFHNDTIGAIEFTVAWTCDGLHHEEWFLGRKVNPVNDIFPRDMRAMLEGMRPGESLTMEYAPRLCIPRYKEALVRTLPLHRLRPKTRSGSPIIPRLGRFYPQGHIDGLLDVYPDTLTPFRLTGLDHVTFTADCNHPLALFPITIGATIQYIEPRESGTYGSLTHWRETLCDWGPGMQARHNGQPTDFSTPDFFDQRESVAHDFIPPPTDGRALENFNAICSRTISPDMHVLDFSPGASVPYEDTFDAAMCWCGLEYMRDPLRTLQGVTRLLPPGAPVYIGFTDHHDLAHVVRGWTELHPFERLGYALECLRLSGLDLNGGTVTMRNDWRPEDDPHFLARRGVSDPVFVAYGRKR